MVIARRLQLEGEAALVLTGCKTFGYNKHVSKDNQNSNSIEI